MDINTDNWTVGQLVRLDRQERDIKTSGTTTYSHYVASRYICIREAAGNQRGILVKVLGKVFADQLRIVEGKPFCNDDVVERFEENHYCSYPFPQAKDVREALDIIRGNASLVQKFEDANMHINPNSTFWVSDTTRNRLFLKRAQVYNAREDKLGLADADVPNYRVSIVYFTNGKLTW